MSDVVVVQVVTLLAFAIVATVAFLLGRVTAPAGRRVVWSDADRRRRACIAQLALTPLQALESYAPVNAETLPECSAVRTACGRKGRRAA